MRLLFEAWPLLLALLAGVGGLVFGIKQSSAARERAKTLEAGGRLQREVTDAANRGPRTGDAVIDRLRKGGF